MTATGAPMPVISETVRKKQPIGTPALPTAAITEIKTHRSIAPIDRWIPPFCMTKSELTSIKAAQPFILIVVQIGRTNLDTFGLTPSLFSADWSVTGRVAAELLVKSAIMTAGLMALRTLSGLIPLAIKNKGNTKKNCKALPIRMTAVYLPFLLRLVILNVTLPLALV